MKSFPPAGGDAGASATAENAGPAMELFAIAGSEEAEEAGG